MNVITLRIPSELKTKMKRRSDINWSEVIREAIIKRIEMEERSEAIRKIDEIRQRVKPVKRGEIDKWLKEDRER